MTRSSFLHLIGEKTEEGKSSDTQKRWTAILDGVEVGEIQFDSGRREPYVALYRDDERKGLRLSFLNSFCTLIAAKQKLLDWARQHPEQMMKWRDGDGISAASLPAYDRQFYPTPSNVAGELLKRVDWHGVKFVLEPSAGRGDLINYARTCCEGQIGRRYHYTAGDTLDIDCVEIDHDLRAILESKSYRVVHDDFLTYYPHKHYDLIIMNPPFADGDMHLLHALELCRNGGQIACILNAETIRNPYTNSRRMLLRELERQNAEIRFMNNAFKHAARRADVEIAFINVNIPAAAIDNSIFEGLKKARAAGLSDEEQRELAPSNNVERLLLEYDLLCETGLELMRKYNGTAPHIQTSADVHDAPLIELSVCGHTCSKCNSEDVNNFLKSARSRYWHELFELPELRERMTSDMKSEYDSMISEMREYEFSRFNIQQVLDKLRGQLNAGVEAAIEKCFDKLSQDHAYQNGVENGNIHYYNGWKSNKAHYVSMKCVIPTWGCFARGYHKDKYGRYKDVLEGLDVHGCFQVLDDLEKALDYLDRGETPQTNLVGMLQNAAAIGATSVSCKYFDVVFYKKGTCHIKFRDQKIVDRLNIYVGRNRAWLPPAYGKARYEEMDEESKHVIDEFQGSEAYEAVVQSPSDYIVETSASPLLIA